MAGLSSERRLLPAGAAVEAQKIATWMCSKEARFFHIENQIAFCTNKSELSSNLLPNGYSKSQISHVTAMHFEKPTVLPVYSKFMVELIPVDILRGPVQVGDKKYIPNTFFHVSNETQDEGETRVSGDFFALLFMTPLKSQESTEEHCYEQEVVAYTLAEKVTR
ncbi:hypothetical protein F5Y07DRAFT_401691 [Xylaria sp. FL0933]|nr:hypothetical protein F5Y07DRAFT_401691 [Xylaria sp. FL0933]